MSSPITKVHPTKPPYLANFADGQKKMAPDQCISDELVSMKNRLTQAVQRQAEMNACLIK